MIKDWTKNTPFSPATSADTVVNPLEFFRQSVAKAPGKAHLTYIDSDNTFTSYGSSFTAAAAGQGNRPEPKHSTWDFTLFASWQQVCQLVMDLQAQGVQAGDRVGICLPNSPLHLWLHLACAQLGAITLLLPYRASTQELAVILADARSRLVYVSAPEKRFETLPVTTCVYTPERADSSENRELALASLAQPVPAPPPHTLAALLYTSGSSGKPKGVCLTHENLHYASLNFRAGFAYQADRGVSGVCAPLSHIGGFNGTTLDRFLHGGKVVIFSSFIPSLVLHYLTACQVNMMFLVPTMAWALVACPGWEESDLSAFTKVLIGGAILRQDLREVLARKGIFPIHVWGMTELAGSGTCISTAEESFDSSVNTDATAKLPIGRAFPHNQIRLYPFSSGTGSLDPDLEIEPDLEAVPALEIEPDLDLASDTGVEPAAADLAAEIAGSSLKNNIDPDGDAFLATELGEIAVKGPAVFHAYWHEAELKRGRSGYQLRPREGYFLSGDLAKAEAGVYYLSGRKNRLFKSGGEFISPDLIEEILSKHPLVKAAAAYGVKDPYWGEALYVTLVLQENAETLISSQLCHAKTLPINTPMNIDSTAEVTSPCSRNTFITPVSDSATIPDWGRDNPDKQFFSQQLEKVFKEYLLDQGIAPWKLPKRFFYRDALPLNGNGKISYQTLQVEATAQLAQHA